MESSKAARFPPCCFPCTSINVHQSLTYCMQTICASPVTFLIILRHLRDAAQKVQGGSSRLYTAFIDFKQEYDSIPGQARGGRQQGGGPGSNPCGRGGDKDALYRWESMGGSFLNVRSRTASVDLSFFHPKEQAVGTSTHLSDAKPHLGLVSGGQKPTSRTVWLKVPL
eukprot:342283-Pelagomonas_calceolata.AAC.1